jgi:Putative beta-barrel porin-2, OmpL-like. bbp2
MKTTTLLVALIATFLTAGLSAESQTSDFKFSGYVEIYYSYDFNQPPTHDRPSFLFSHNRHNEVNLNLGFLKAEYAKDRVRGNFALMAGTYAQANLSAEPDVLKNVFEANVGFKLSEDKNLWVDTGIFPSHIGFESAIAKDCWTLTRSILAENSPYYETGGKISYTSDSGKWFVSGLILNGWQRIQRVEGNNPPAFGTQLTYKPNDGTTLNYSTFIGSDKPDSSRQWRYFHNLYGIFQIRPKIGVTAGFNIGWEQKSKGSGDYNNWFSPVVIVRYTVSERINITARSEYYQDENGVIISTGTPNGFKTVGYSANFDYLISDHMLWRIEGRGFQSKDDIFVSDGEPSSQNHFFTTSLAVWF